MKCQNQSKPEHEIQPGKGMQGRSGKVYCFDCINDAYIQNEKEKGNL